MKRIDKVYEMVVLLKPEYKKGITAIELSEKMDIDRSNVSRYLNILYKNGRLKKSEGRPVRYSVKSDVKLADSGGRINFASKSKSMDRIIGADMSLKIPIQHAKAAILYPPKGIHTLILGETGVGKSMFAELMYRFSIESGAVSEDAPFIRFNCADYADNPQLLISHIFGVKKGAYTGADRDKVGLLKKADGGIIFLDEIHRLSPQGQEMLFTFIDKGVFRLLGESEEIETAEVQIIAATTEEPSSYLLDTFKRRIPMTITLPSLKDRGIKERFLLVESFIREESKRISKSIYVDKSALISFILYDCPSNIGQLRSDIQLSCAKAFLNFKSGQERYIILRQPELQSHVKKGLMKLKKYRVEVETLLDVKKDILRFSHEDSYAFVPSDEVKEMHFYESIENKVNTLKTDGLDKEEISEIINIDIESHFKKYIVEVDSKYKREEISKIAGEEIVNMTNTILKYAESKLGREYDEKIYFALALHLNGSVERIKSGKRIYHPKLNLIRVNYQEEFLVAMEVAKMLDIKFEVETPLDEIGYITMFLAPSENIEQIHESKVGILLLMHGRSTASSMVQVTNELVGEEHAVAIDMPLSMSPKDMYEIVKNKVIELDDGRGVMLLVDMGSLTNFGDMVYEETGIITKTIEMVSTPIAIEATRKAVIGRDINEIYSSIKDINNYVQKSRKSSKKKNMIITACFTGEGASERLKKVIEANIVGIENVKVKNLEMLNRSEFVSSIDVYKEDYNVIAIVSTIDIQVEDIPFISAMDIFADDGIKRLKQIVESEELYKKVEKSIKGHLKNVDITSLVPMIRDSIDEIEKKLVVEIIPEVKMGIIIHMCFMVDKLRGGEQHAKFKDLEGYENKYAREMVLLKTSLKELEKEYSLEIGRDEVAYICKMFIENDRNRDCAISV